MNLSKQESNRINGRNHRQKNQFNNDFIIELYEQGIGSSKQLPSAKKPEKSSRKSKGYEQKLAVYNKAVKKAVFDFLETYDRLKLKPQEVS